VPVYAYVCDTCGADLEILHAMGKDKASCGLACKRRDAGAFGKGTVHRVVTAANVVARRAFPTGSDTRSTPTVPPEELRTKALERLGDKVTEKDLERARKGGLTVYRNSGAGTFVRDGGDKSLPKRIHKPKEDA
jgi:hypothetical protein